MTELVVIFKSNGKSPLEIIKEIDENLKLRLRRGEISEYNIEIGEYDSDASFSLVHETGIKETLPLKGVT